MNIQTKLKICINQFDYLINKLSLIIESHSGNWIFIYCVLINIIIYLNYYTVSFINDELFSIVLTNSQFSLKSVICQTSLYDASPFFYYVLLHFIQIVFGDGEFSLRFISILSHLLSIFVVYLIVKRLYSKKEALLSVILFSFSPFLLLYGIEVRTYSLFLLTALLTFYFLLQVVNFKNSSNKYSINLYIVFAVVCSTVHYFGLLLVILQILYILINNSRNIIIKKHHILILIILISIYPIIHFFPAMEKISDWTLNSTYPACSGEFNNKNIFLMKEFLPSLSFNLNHKFELYILFISTFIFLLNYKKIENQFILFFILAPLVIINISAFFFMSFLRTRYFIFLVPFIYVVVSYGISKIFKKYFYLMIIFLLLFLSFNIKTIIVNQFDRKDKDSILFFKENLMDDSSVLMHMKWYYIDYYLKKLKIETKAIAFETDKRYTLEKALDTYKNVYFIDFDAKLKSKFKEYIYKDINDKICKIERISNIDNTDI